MSRASETVRDFFTSACAACRLAAVMRFTVPRWSSWPQRPQLFSRLKYDSTSPCAGSFTFAIVWPPRVDGILCHVPHVHRTMCPMNCHPTLCGMLVEVEDDRLVGVRGDPDNPDSQGFLCVRGQASREIIGNPKRILQPMLRARRGGDHWREAGWDEALDLIATRMQA